jgi:hypothetical protein
MNSSFFSAEKQKKLISINERFQKEKKFNTNKKQYHLNTQTRLQPQPNKYVNLKPEPYVNLKPEPYIKPQSALYVNPILQIKLKYTNTTDIENTTETELENTIDAETENTTETELENTIDAELENTIDAETENTTETELENTIDAETENTTETELENTIDAELENTIDAETENTTETETENTTETELENTIDAETENTTDAETENTTDAETENTTETELENTIDSELENTIDAETENTIDAELENTIDAETENTTEAETENTIDAETENTTEADTENTIDAETENTIDAETENTTEAETENTIDAETENTTETELEVTHHTIQPSIPIRLQKTVNIVYQYSYKNSNVSGFGDFLRGCFFMLQFSERHNVPINFEIYKHPISQYFTYFKDKYNNINDSISNNIYIFDTPNYEYKTFNNKIYYTYIDVDSKLIKYLNNMPLYENNAYIYLILHPKQQSITQSHKQKICEIINPTDTIVDAINKTLFNLNLNKHNFKIIHARTYDTNSNNISPKQLAKFIKHIKIIREKTTEDILLMSNSNILKQIILKYVPTLKTIFCDITHVANKTINNDTNICNTLRDFFIMSNSNQIYALSVYDHGSGFSKWCSVAYNIPYVCYSIK